tara:strand:+ start:1275 stop:1424 length:150 start_codon:yes stop_codon:yes gene_type:complete
MKTFKQFQETLEPIKDILKKIKPDMEDRTGSGYFKEKIKTPKNPPKGKV